MTPRSPLTNVYDKNPYIDDTITSAFRRMDGVDHMYFDSDASDDHSVKSGDYGAIDLKDRITIEREDHSLKTMSVEEFLTSKDRFLPGKSPRERLELLKKAAKYEVANRNPEYATYNVDPGVTKLLDEIDPQKPQQTAPSSPLVASLGAYLGSTPKAHPNAGLYHL